MKVPMRWLSEFVDTGLTSKELAYRLTMAGLEAEKVEEIGGGWHNVFVGVVTDVAQHPNADRLVLATVEAGEHQLTVVTGAPNIAAGQKVALALAGARLYATHSEALQLKTLKPGTIRGVRSEGMVCSEKELGLSDEHEGILVLEPDAPVGVPLADWLGDAVIEFEITPNLAHAFSIVGIAREAAAVTDRPLKTRAFPPLSTLPQADASLVRVEAPDLCRRYLAAVIEGLTVGPSPVWIVRRLRAAGLRPINNVVDVTNYVMLEYGQPLHAFDRDRLHEGRVVVRRADPVETIETLDHQTRELAPEMLVIADVDRAVGIAGVMGGVDSEVDDRTTVVLLEAANFDLKSVRHTARALKLRTDASARFERGLDPNLVQPAAQRAIELLLAVCPESRLTAVRDVYPEPVKPGSLTMPFARIERVLGIRYEPDEVKGALARLDFDPIVDGNDDDATLRVTVPTYRADVRLPEDVVEEVARIIGYETLPETMPLGRNVPVWRDPLYRLQRSTRRVLTATGCSEAITHVTLSEPMLRLFRRDGDEVGFLHHSRLDDLVRLRNPLQAERPYLRPTLVPSLLEKVAANRKHEDGVRLFELGRVYLPRGRNELPHEASVAAIALAGQREPLSRFAEAGELDFFDLKGTLEALLARLGVTHIQFRSAQLPALHPGRAAEVVAGPTCLGIIGELRPDIAATFELEGDRVSVAELDLDLILAQTGGPRSEVVVPRFLPVRQDFAVVVADDVPAADVTAALRVGAGALASDAALFDIYRGPQLGDGNKSLAFRVTFTAPDRALTDTELGKVRTRIEKVLADRVAGTLRG